jgi:hypothetical protein
LAVAQLIKQLSLCFLFAHPEGPIERPACGNHTKTTVEHDKGLADGVYDRMGERDAIRELIQGALIDQPLIPADALHRLPRLATSSTTIYPISGLVKFQVLSIFKGRNHYALAPVTVMIPLNCRRDTFGMSIYLDLQKAGGIPMPAWRILVVEDEILIAMDLAGALEALGFDVVGPAATLAAGTSLLESSAPDGVLLDINLRNETSYPLARACIACGTWFAFVTATHPESIPQDFRTAPRLAKPWTHGDLERLMDRRFG